MIYAPLAVAVLLGLPAALLHHRGKAHRIAAVLASLAFLALLAGVPFLLHLILSVRASGPWLLFILAGLIASVVFFVFDFILGHHKTTLFGRGGSGGGGQGGGPKRYFRPLGASLGLIVFGLMAANNVQAIMAQLGTGSGETVTSITHSGA